MWNKPVIVEHDKVLNSHLLKCLKILRDARLRDMPVHPKIEGARLGGIGWVLKRLLDVGVRTHRNQVANRKNKPSYSANSVSHFSLTIKNSRFTTEAQGHGVKTITEVREPARPWEGPDLFAHASTWRERR